ncbi:MAG TPA: hypothetical protein VFI25_00610 [Planctomycetota bacterium]|jgi:hypothetical protein|nr:hypothetical protein [Planctomycetota bacterium]
MTGESLARRPFLVGLAASCALFAPAFLRPDRALLPLDHFGAWQPWLGDRSSAPVANPILYDQAAQFLSWNEFLRRSLAAGVFPLWNPHQALGEPFAGNVQARLLDPLSGLVLAVNGATGTLYGWTLSAVFRTALSFFFAASLARLLGAAPLGGLAAGAVYAFGGVSVVYLNYPLGHVLPWIAASACAAVRLRREPRGRSLAALAGAVALSALAGHPETTAVGLAAVGATFLSVPARGRPPIGRFLLGVTIGLALASPVLLPFLEYLAHSAVRGGRAGARRVALEGDRPALWIPWTLAAGALFLLVRRRFGEPAPRGRDLITLPLVAAGLLGALHFGTRSSGGESLATLLWPNAISSGPFGEAFHTPLQTSSAAFVGLGALFLLLGALVDSLAGRRSEPFVWIWLFALADFLEEPATRLLLHGASPGSLLGPHVSSSAAVLAGAIAVARAFRFESAEAARQTWDRMARGVAVASLCALGVWLDGRIGPLRLSQPAEGDPAARLEGALLFPSPGISVARRLVANGYVVSREPLSALSLELASPRGGTFRRPCDRWRERPEKPRGSSSYEWSVLGWNTARIPRGTYAVLLRGRDAAGRAVASERLGEVVLGPFEDLGSGRFLLILLAAAAVLVGRLLRPAPWTSLPLLAAIGADPVAAGWRFNETHPGSLRELVQDPFVEEVRREVGHDRVLTDHRVLPPESATLVGLRDVWSYDALQPAATKRLLDEIGGRPGLPPERWGSIGLGNPILPLLGVRGLLGTGESEPPKPWRLLRSRGPLAFYAREGGDGRAFLAEVGADPPLPAPGFGRVEFLEDGPNQVRLRSTAARSALLVLADTHFPGWTARLDGARAEIVLVAGAVRGVKVPAGEHVVEFRYAPFSFTLGLLLAAVGVAASLLLGGGGRARARR